MASITSSTANLISWIFSQTSTIPPFAKILVSSSCMITQLTLATFNKQIKPQYRDDNTVDKMLFVFRGILASVAIADQMQLFYKGGLITRLAIDSINFFAVAFSSIQILHYGTHLFSNFWNNQNGTSEKVTTSAMKILMGALLVSIASFSLYSSTNTAIKEVNGLSIYNALDDTQKHSALKYGVIPLLNHNPDCQATLIDSSSWPAVTPNFIQELYRHCSVQTPKINNTVTNPCVALEKTANAKGKIDILYLWGHGDTQSMYGFDYNDPYHFWGWGNSTEILCLEPYLAPNAIVGLMGCNTAKGNDSLTARAASLLPGKKIIGFSDYFTPFFSTTQQIGKQIDIQAWFPEHGWKNIAQSYCKSDSEMICKT